MMLFKKNKKENEQIKRSQEIIKKEKIKIKKTKAKIKEEKQSKFYQTKIGKFIKKIFFINDNQEQEIKPKSQIILFLYFTLIGFIICLLLLFAISGGKNYFKLYYELNN